MNELKSNEVNEVSGGAGFTDAGLVIIGIGLSGGPATGAFGLLVGGACLYVGHYQKM